MSPGYIHDPLQIINLIADNIRDRYKTGFSVIKEIIQNADDAGGGNSDEVSTEGGGDDNGGNGNGGNNNQGISFEFGLSPGLSDVDHPLLKGPGLFFFNNGRFTQSDTIAIRSFGLNRKAIDNATIGKFGLGMKSVFHFCEALFFLAQDQDRSYAEILNPWSGPAEFQSLHTDWDRLSSRDAESMKGNLCDIIGSYLENSESWFLLWLPLRSTRHTKNNGQEIGSIVAEFPGDDLSRLEFLKDPKMPMRLARLLPLLRRIVSIRFWEFEVDRFKTVYRIVMEAPDSRTQFPARSNPFYVGHIKCENQNVSEDSYRLNYAGLERQLNSELLKNLMRSEFWPRSYVRDENGRSVQAPDKARAHCAAVFSRYGETDEANLDIRWAVFLPIETGLESIHCDGEQSYCLTLHGYFFVDAGRAEVTGLCPANPSDYEKPPDSEAELRYQWNKHLSQSGTLPLVIPALVEFAKHTGINKTEIDNLCKALCISKTFGQNRHAICDRYQFVFRLKPDRARWALVRRDALLLPLPAPPTTEQSRPWNTLQNLDALEGEPEFIQDDAPHLMASANPLTWNESLLEKVLDIDVSVVFQDAGQLNYMCLFLSREYIRRLLGRDSIQSRLKSILRSALRTHGQNLTQYRTRFQEIVAFVLPIYRFPVTATWTEALIGLLQCQTGIVVLPREMDSLDSPGKAALSVEDAVIFLKKIGNMVNASIQNPDMLNECRQLSRQIIASVSAELLPEVFRQVRSEKIIEGFDCKRNYRWLFSIKELESRQVNGLLFLFSQGTTDEQRLYLASVLQQAILETVLVINTYNAQITIGEHHGLASCNSEGCLRALGKSALSLTGFKQRKELIKHLAGSTLDRTDLIRGMRYLLHGSPDHLENDQPLWTRGYQQGAVWEKMWQQLPENSGGDWNLLNRSLIEQIPPNSWNALGIREINPQEILNRFRKVGFDQMDCTIFSREERDTVLIAAENDGSLWRRIPFHETLSGQLTSILDQNVFLESKLQIPAEFQDTVTIVRLNENPRVQVSQRNYLPVLNDESLIRILVESQQPHTYWNEILNALQRAAGVGVINRKLRELLQERCWLIDTKGRPVRPSDVINLQPIADEVCRLSILIKGTYVAPELLDSNIRQHLYWGELANQFFATGDDGLEKLGLLLGESPAHAIGKICYRDITHLKSFMDVLKDMPIELDLPSWSVLSVIESAYETESCIKHILPNIQRPLSIDRTIVLLEWLKNRSEACNTKVRKKIIDVYECYLDVFVQTPECRDTLHIISLLNRAGGWCCASDLCAGAEGVAIEYLIHDRQKEILRSIIQSAGHFEVCENENQGEFEVNVYAAVAEAAERLKVYFAPWEDQIPPNLIRVFLSLLGDDKQLLQLAESYEGRHSIDWIRTNLPWIPNTHLDRDGRKGWLYGLNQDEAIQQHRFIVEPVPGQTIQVRSLCGSIIDVRLSEEYDSLIVGGLWYEWPKDNLIFPKIRLRQIDVEAFSPEQLSAFLRNTAEYLLQNAYSQGDHDLESLWSEMGENEQLDIRIAQLLVMKHIPYYLRQLGTHQHERLLKALKRWNDARYRVAEFSDHPEQRREFEAQEIGALENIQNLLVNDREVQQTVLEAVRSKITDFQYSRTSILFELFQNADDAVVELCEIYLNQPGFTNDAGLPPSTHRLVLRKTPDHLSIMHWGRAVNYAGGSGFSGRERGFHQDLEKMLILSSSDKNTGESGVTGKFGLGFKSVFLISDMPKLISGRLQAEILGGMYPKRYEVAQPLKALLKEEAPGGRGGTLIHLPIDVGNLEEICEPFEKVAGLLTVFSKQIRTLEIDQNSRRQNHEWAPTIVLDADGVQIEYGLISLASTASEAKTPVLHFRFGGGGGLLVGIGPQGFRELPEDLPAIWVVAPTHEDTGIGFAINGGFEVDAGRARLSSNDESTIIESQRIGESLATGLLALFDEAQNDWDRFREWLCLGSELRPYDFWASVWQVLTNAWGRPLGGKVEKIVVNAMTGTRGLGRLARDRMAVPTGLWGDLFQTLTCIDKVKFILRGALSQERIFQHIANWDVFRQKVKPTEVVSSQVFETLRKVSPVFVENKGQWQSLKISGILNWLAENDYRVLPATAAVLGQMITSDFLTKLKATSAGQNEPNEIAGLLRRIKFQTKPGSWRKSRYLLVLRPIDDISDDEPLRAAFAPHDLLLSDTYENHGIVFFMVCRGKMEAPVEEMVSWILDAEDSSTKCAALRYLLDGELGDRVSLSLREKSIIGSWLDGLNRDDEVFHGWDEDEIYEILYRKLTSIEQLREMGNGLWGKEWGRPKLDPTVVLPKIKNWWLKDGESLIGDYEEATYPEAKIPYLRENETGEISRANWLILFLLGAFHTLGRSRREQHRSFIQLCQQNKWWDTFAAESPESRADEWMRVLDEYIDAQIDESQYEMWINRFPAIYRAARHLDDYKEAFLSIDRHETLPDLGGITVTRANLRFQGGGISAPPVRRTFGIGVCFVVRELKRAGLLTSNVATPHCYVPVARVRRLMSELDCPDLNEGQAYPGQSKIIHRFLCEHLGKREAEFQGAYDIPLQIMMEKPELQIQLLGSVIGEDSHI